MNVLIRNKCQFRLIMFWSKRVELAKTIFTVDRGNHTLTFMLRCYVGTAITCTGGNGWSS